MITPTAKTFVKMKTLFLNGFHCNFVTCLKIRAKFKCPSKKFWIRRTTKSGLTSPATSFLFISGSSPIKRRALVVTRGMT